MTARAERVRLHRELADVCRGRGCPEIADIHDRIANGLEVLYGMDERVDQAARDLLGSLQIDTRDTTEKEIS